MIRESLSSPALIWASHESAASLGVAGLGTRNWAYRWIEEQVKRCKDIDNIVDIGGGSIDSRFSQTIASYCRRFYSVDRLCAPGQVGNRRQISLEIEGGLGPIFSRESVDIAISASAIEHLNAAGQSGIFKDIERILRPGGLFCATISYICGLTPEVIALINSDSVFEETGSNVHKAFNLYECLSPLGELCLVEPPDVKSHYPGHPDFDESFLLGDEGLIHDRIGSYGEVRVKKEIEELRLRWYELGIVMVKG